MSSEKNFNPFHQFEITPLIKIDLFGLNLSFTNSALATFLCLTIVSILFGLAKFKQTKFIPNKAMVCFELLHKMIKDMVVQMIGPYADVVYQKLIFTFFLSILSMNIIGLLPFGFTPTSHIIITFFMAFIIFLVCVGISIAKHKLGFFAMFVPKGTPLWMMPLMFVLEIFSYLARPMSLSIRLAANMIAGHVMLDVIAYFAILMGIFGLLPFAFLIILQMFEIGIAILQAYIFSMLACVYISESKHH